MSRIGGSEMPSKPSTYLGDRLGCFIMLPLAFPLALLGIAANIARAIKV